MSKTVFFHSCITPLRQSCIPSRSALKIQSRKLNILTDPSPTIQRIRRRLKWSYLGLGFGAYLVGLGISERYLEPKALGIEAYEREWLTFTLQSRQPISPTVSIFTLKAERPAILPAFFDKFFMGAVWAVDIAQPQLQIRREYTPLPPALDPETGKTLVKNDVAELQLLIRKEPGGEVSSYVHGLSDGAEVQISRPQPQIGLWPVGEDREAKTLVMIVGGTGITAALQAIHATLETRRFKQKETGAESRPFLHIMWANRRREDCLGGISDNPVAPMAKSSWWNLGGLLGGSQVVRTAETEPGVSPLVDEINRLKAIHGERLKVDYFVDEEGTFVTADAVEKVLASKPDGKAFIAVSGPEGFMTNLAGEKRMQKNQITERPSVGMLASLRRQDWELMVLG